MANKKFNYPSEETLRKMDKKLAKVKGSASLPPDASPVDVLKHELCAQFVRYHREYEVSQRELAKIIGLSEARMSEILHYRHGRFTADHLMKYLAKIKPNLKVKVA
ncbi:MAG: XRE family transcriptional regulator [Pseudobdellovibrionaceae bacterium]